jgi:hypothetical protein
MEKIITMSESTARFTFTAACGLSMFAAGAAIVLRTKDAPMQAAVFLFLALLACTVTLVSYRRYKLVRGQRWQRELKATQDELGQVLNHARMALLIDHITGPLAAESLEPNTGDAGAGKD